MGFDRGRLIIIGASGHGKVVADIAELNGYTDIIFLDDDTSKVCCGKYPIVGIIDDVLSIDGEVFVAIGNEEIREKILDSLADRIIPILIHPNAVVARETSIGAGTVIMAGAVVNPNVTIGKGVIVNTCSSIDHDCTICDYVHVAVGAHVCGTVNVHKGVWIGAGAIVINNININSDCFIGAGAIVTEDINDKGTYLGVPARKYK